MQVITKANNTLNGISSSSVCTEVIQSAQGMEYLLGEESHAHTHTHVHIGSPHYKQARIHCILGTSLLKNSVCGLTPSEGQRGYD